MSDTTQNLDLATLAARTGVAVADLAKNDIVFRAAVDAFRAGDGDSFTRLLEQIDYLRYCEDICRWFASKDCVLDCLELFGHHRFSRIRRQDGSREIEQHGIEMRQGSGEGVVDFSGGEVGGAVVGVGGGEHEFLGAQALAAIDGFQHLSVQAGGDGEQLRGDECEMAIAAVVEIEGARVQAGPVPAGDAPAGAVAAHGNAGRGSDLGFAGTGIELAEGGRCRMQRIRGDGDPVRGAAGE